MDLQPTKALYPKECTFIFMLFVGQFAGADKSAYLAKIIYIFLILCFYKWKLRGVVYN